MITDSDKSTKKPIKVNKIFVFGNPDLPMDSFPLRILPELRATFSNSSTTKIGSSDFKVEFVVVDPNEEWEVPEELVVLDTVVGLKNVVVFEDLEKFIPAPNISMHDFDALANLRFLKKLGKIKRVQVIGVPPLEAFEGEVLAKICKCINEMIVKLL
jgi:hypothetical protein